MAQRPKAGGVGTGFPLPASPLGKTETLDVVIEGLADLDSDQLRLQWRNQMGGSAPAHLPRWLLLRLLAYRMQTAALGDLDKAMQRLLRSPKEKGGPAGARFETRGPATREGVSLNPGALLVREWKGKLERVMVLENGFAWNGDTYRSLSQIAKAITGTSWNGHRFFGLRSIRPQRERRNASRPLDGNRGAPRDAPLCRAEHGLESDTIAGARTAQPRRHMRHENSGR